MNLKKEFPWNVSFAKRCGILRKYIKAGYKISVILYGVADDSTFRYRAYNISEALEIEENEWKCIYFFLNEIKGMRPLLSRIELLTVTRVQWTVELNEFIYEAKRYGIRVLFDVDDLVVLPNYIPEIMNSLNSNYEEEDYRYWFTYISRLNLSAALCSGFTTTNDYLGRILSETFHMPYKVIPNSLNCDQLEVSAEARNRKNHDDTFKIGYFSGTPSHVNDLKLCGKALIEFLNVYPQSKLIVVGYMDTFPQYMHEYIKQGRVEHRPFVDYISLQDEIASVDVNIVPLVQNTFTNCKSELKFFEAAIVDTLTIASPTYCYVHALKDNENGYICSDDEWYCYLELAYRNKEETEQIIKRAREYAMDNYSGRKFLERILNAYNYYDSQW